MEGARDLSEVSLIIEVIHLWALCHHDLITPYYHHLECYFGGDTNIQCIARIVTVLKHFIYLFLKSCPFLYCIVNEVTKFLKPKYDHVTLISFVLPTIQTICMEPQHHSQSSLPKCSSLIVSHCLSGILFQIMTSCNTKIKLFSFLFALAHTLFLLLSLPFPISLLPSS